MANGDNEMKTIMKACLGECDQEAIKGVFDCKRLCFMVCFNRALCKTATCLVPHLCGVLWYQVSVVSCLIGGALDTRVGTEHDLLALMTYLLLIS